MQNFNIVTIRIFLAVAREGSIGAAARREHIAASAVSRRISDLEQNLNVALIHRTPSGVSLTPAGEAFTRHCEGILEQDIATEFIKNVDWDLNRGAPYVVKANSTLIEKLNSAETLLGFTATSNGFYGPQGRILRIPIVDEGLNSKISKFDFNGLAVTNFEMETAAIYAFAKLLGHKAISMNAIIANRVNGAFSTEHNKTIEKLIQYTLEKLVA